MSSDLSCAGSVPPLYREIYDIIAPSQERVDRELFLSIFAKSNLPNETITQIWDAVDIKTGFLSRSGIYKALALTAFAQHGKPVSDKLLETFSGQELPKPTLGDLSDLKAFCIHLRRDMSPTILNYTYSELYDLENIKVELVPEKKGLILKHVEYEITSQKFHSTVLRRYNDFLVINEMLMMRFPYRMIPRLPPKKMMGANREFIEHRRKSLRRYLNIIGRHPRMHNDKLFECFLTFVGSDVQTKLREQFRGIPDEFMTSNLADKAKDLVPRDTQSQLANSKEHIKALYNSVTKLKDISERLVSQSTAYASDMLQFGKELRTIGTDTTCLTTWTTGTSSSWPKLKCVFKNLSLEFAAVADKSTQEAADEEEMVVEHLAIFLDILTAYRDLCDRHEKGVLHDHQRALQKMGQYKKRMMSATVGTTESGPVEQLEQKILQQESQIANMENRNYYSLHCLQMETQLVHAYLDILIEIVTSLVDVQSEAHTELSKVWCGLRPLLESSFKDFSLPNSPRSTSPIGSPIINHTSG
ncbi:sorting nexin-8 [Octopus sinensis]|uniref:Sorting nexin-8 n=1 Tax=Octopus sinensis TaxID=2607531 RepID=A0A6P7TH02_9MOLL|nr:sorting nexin-8 [Octopus sinensis]